VLDQCQSLRYKGGAWNLLEGSKGVKVDVKGELGATLCRIGRSDNLLQEHVPVTA
jgi:hypothetical protein